MKVILLMVTATLPKIAVSCSITILLAGTAELVEAEKRKILVFSCIVVARIVLLTAPFIGALAAIHKILPLTIYGVLNIIGGIAMAILSTKSSERPSNSVTSSDNIFTIEYPNAFFSNGDFNRVSYDPFPENNFQKTII